MSSKKKTRKKKKHTSEEEESDSDGGNYLSLEQKSPASSSSSGDIVAVGVFVNQQMILKVFPEQEMETLFRSSYKDFKSECLSFLKQVDEKDDLEVRHYNINEQYTMFYAEVGDKEAVFLMSGEHEAGLPSNDALNGAVNSIIDYLTNMSNSSSYNNDSLQPQKNNNRKSSFVGFSSIEEVFRTMDLDGSGKIDEASFNTGLGVLGLNWSSSQTGKLFKQIDDSDNGYIDFDSFMRFMMKPSNKKSWKELKRAINSSINMPSVKAIKESPVALEVYQKKLSHMEKLVNMLEESMVEQQLPPEEQQYWRNKITAHREFIRKHQDVVGRAMAQQTISLKKKLGQLEKTNKRMSVDLDKARKNSKIISLSDNDNSNNIDDDNTDALVKRLRRENQEFKRKIQSQQADLRKLTLQKQKAGSSTPRQSSSRRGSGLNLDQSQMEEMLTKLKKENYELRSERNELRKSRDELQIQLKAAKDRMKDLEQLAGGDEDLLRQLHRARADNKNMRKDKKKMREDMLLLKGLDNALRKKLIALTEKVNRFDPSMAEAIRSKTTSNEMISELATQLTLMIDRYNESQSMIKKLQKELREQSKRHEEEIQDLKDKIAELMKKLNTRKEKIIELENIINNKKEVIEELNDRLKEAEEYHNENKKLRRKLADLEDEIKEFQKEKELHQKEISEAKLREKNLKKQLKMIEKMPGNATLLKKIDRLYKIFNKLDKDKDKLLNFEEFQAGAADLGFGESYEEQKEAFDQMDKDEDGYIDFEDFKQACLKQMEQSQNKSDEEWKMTYKLLNKPPVKWNNEEVNLWLSHIGMEQYQDEFDNIDGNMLISMKNARELKDLGMQKNAHIRKTLREIKDLKARDDLISNMAYENNKQKEELDQLKKNGPTWEAVHLLQRKVRDLEGQVRKEKYARENIMLSVKNELKKDKRFDNLSPDYEDVLAEVALLKGALNDANQKLRDNKKKDKDQGSAYENDTSPPQQLKDYGKPIGRFLQKWYVLANHTTQYWISRTNAELKKRDDHFNKLRELKKLKKDNDEDDDDDNDEKDEEEKDAEDGYDEYTESLDWILFDTRQKRIISELRMQGRGAPNDPKDIKLQMSVSPSGPWTDVIEHQMQNHGKRERIGGFEAEARFWRVVFMSNYGEDAPAAPRYVLYECQFWGPLDEDVENNHFVIE